jgi:N-acetylneuraminate synthase
MVIAEAGVNHNGSLGLASRLVDAAAEAGADAIKFQTFSSEHVISSRAPKAPYQLLHTPGTESQLEMVKKLELSEAGHAKLAARCNEKGLRFMSTPFDIPSLNFLVDDLNMEIIKVASGEITNAPFLLQVARKGRKIILSTGMSTLGDIETALGVLAYGFLEPKGVPAKDAFIDAYCSQPGKEAIRANVRLLHCNSEYPTPIEDANLRAISTLAAVFGLPTGYSDHTQGISAPIAAVALGACVIEKHLTLDRTMPGPDHTASIEPVEFKAMVAGIREVERALGTGIKQPSPSEKRNIAIARRSLVALRKIKRGETFSSENIGAKRPGHGLPPAMYWDLLGKTSARDYDEDDLIVVE